MNENEGKYHHKEKEDGFLPSQFEVLVLYFLYFWRINLQFLWGFLVRCLLRRRHFVVLVVVVVVVVGIGIGIVVEVVVVVVVVFLGL